MFHYCKQKTEETPNLKPRDKLIWEQLARDTDDFDFSDEPVQGPNDDFFGEEDFFNPIAEGDALSLRGSQAQRPYDKGVSGEKVRNSDEDQFLGDSFAVSPKKTK